jgi:hypothetical protein
VGERYGQRKTLDERQDEARRRLEGQTAVREERERKRTAKASEKTRRDAFEHYYSLGEGRSYAVVGKRFGRSVVTIGTWAAKYRWREKIREREEEIDRRLVEKAITDGVTSRIEYKNHLDRLLEDFFNDLHNLWLQGKRPSFIRSIDDVEKAMKLSLLLAGERLGGDGVTVERVATISETVKGNPEAQELLVKLYRTLHSQGRALLREDDDAGQDADLGERGR